MNEKQLFQWKWQLYGYLRGRELDDAEIQAVCGAVRKIALEGKG